MAYSSCAEVAVPLNATDMVSVVEGDPDTVHMELDGLQTTCSKSLLGALAMAVEALGSPSPDTQIVQYWKMRRASRKADWQFILAVLFIRGLKI